MTQCSWCAAEIQDAASVCDHCGRRLDLPDASLWESIDDILQEEQLPAADDGPEQLALELPAASTTSETVGSSVSRRELLAILIAVIGGGTLTFALLIAREGPSPENHPVHVETPALKVSEPSPSSIPRAEWNGANRARWVDNQRNSVAFELPADSPIPVWLKQVHPMLVVRCASNRAEVFVFTDTAAKIEPQDDDHTVQFGFDGDDDLTERWPDSVTHDALFAPDGDAFLRRLTRARTMRFRFTPHNASPVVVRFHVSGLTALVEPVARQCGMKK